MRHEIETASGDFFTLDDRKDVYIKVAERLSVLFKRQIFIRWGAGNMKVFFGKSGSNSEYSVAVEASGLVNIIQFWQHFLMKPLKSYLLTSQRYRCILNYNPICSVK